MQYFIDVVLPLPLPKAFTYWVNEEEFEFLQIGQRVGVPFGKNKLYTGIVYKKHRTAPQAYTPKSIEVILDELPIISPAQFAFWEWMSTYYQAALGSILRAALPGAFLLASETFVARRLDIDPDWDGLTDDAFLVMEALEKADLRLEEIQQLVQRKKILPLVHELAAQNYIQILQSLREKYLPKQQRYLRIHPDFHTEKALNLLFEQLKKAPKQSALLLAFCQAEPEYDWMKLSALRKIIDVSSALIRTLCDKQILEEKYEYEDRNLLAPIPLKPPKPLSKAQEKAFHAIQAQWKEKLVVLLEGVTSSGKTEVYFSLIAEQIEKQKQVLYLLPEISLTAQMVQRLQARFGEKVTIFHSKFSQHERVEVWKNIQHHSDKAQIIIGARSALFLPFKNLGLIIVDEEHETSYKQFDPAPRYHARDAAIVLAHQMQAKLLLGSATPSLESRFNAEQGKYGHVQLLERFGQALPPKIIAIDLKEAHRKKQMKGLFSHALYHEIEATLAREQQVILFQNRRGYAPLVECHSCGHVPQCSNCDVSLTYHQANQQLRCHYCGYTIAKPVQCMVCSTPNLNFKGTGTQQIEEQVNDFFDLARVARMDWDTTRGKWAFDVLIDRFAQGEVNVLVGTQMITKGLDFKNVGLVGVINADALLFFPDFRAHEKAFQLLTQVAGRAGRYQGESKVMIQSFSPDHMVIKQVKENDYQSLYTQQLHERKTFEYPPFNRLIRLTLRGRDYTTVDQAATWLGGVLHRQISTPILGPVDPSIGRIRNQYHKQILIKFPNQKGRSSIKTNVSRAIKSMEAIGNFRSVRVNIDVDPA